MLHAWTDFVTAVSPDGKVLLFGNTDIMKLTLADGGVEPWLKTDFIEWAAVFSPDGRWVAYQSNESGGSEIYVQGYPEKRGKRLVSAAGGFTPVWRRDGKELYWITEGGEVAAASMELLTDSVRPGRPQALFRIPPSFSGLFYFQTLDGQRFLVREPESGTQARAQLVIVQNWAAQLRDAK